MAGKVCMQQQRQLLARRLFRRAATLNMPLLLRPFTLHEPAHITSKSSVAKRV
jgi:hypothetical protein